MNSIVIHGRLTRSPELKTYNKNDSGTGSYCNFTVAVDRRMGEETDFFNCRIFGKRAEVINKFFDKGSEIAVHGEMQCSPYEAKDGTKRYPWVLMVNDFDFCGKKSNNAASGGRGPSAEDPHDSFEEIDEDVPF